MSQNAFFFIGELYIDGQPWPCWVARPTSNKRQRPRSEGAEVMVSIPTGGCRSKQQQGLNMQTRSIRVPRCVARITVESFCRMDKPRPHSSEGVLRKPPTSLTVKIKSRRRRRGKKKKKKKITGSEIHKASSLRVCEARLKDMQWQERGSPLPTVLPRGLYAYTESDPAPPIILHLSLCFTPVFSFIFPLHVSTAREKSGVSIPGSHAAFQASVTFSLHQKHKNTWVCCVCAACWVEAGEAQTQPLAPWAENGFTHSISSASIMTVWQHGKLPLAELDEKAISVPPDSGERRGRLMSTPPPTPKSMTDPNCACQQIGLSMSCKRANLHPNIHGLANSHC